MQTYQTWSIDIPMEYIEAETGFEARKAFAAKHRLPVSECMSRMRTLPRKAYDIRFRCTLNGCDWTARLWLRDPSEAFDVMYKRLAYSVMVDGGPRGAGEGKQRYSKDFYRVVSCDVSADQSRPISN